jgi:hypothetical protein
VSRDISLRKVTCYGVIDRSSIPGRGRVFSLRHYQIYIYSEAQPSSYTSVQGALSAREKWSDRKDHSSTWFKLKNAWSSPSPQLSVTAWCLGIGASLPFTTIIVQATIPSCFVQTKEWCSGVGCTGAWIIFWLSLTLSRECVFRCV